MGLPPLGVRVTVAAMAPKLGEVTTPCITATPEDMVTVKLTVVLPPSPTVAYSMPLPNPVAWASSSSPSKAGVEYE